MEKGVNGTLDFVDNTTGQIVWWMPKPYMYDVADNRSYAVTKQIEVRDGRTFLVVHSDHHWLRDTQRVYPVTIDPTWSSTSPAGDVCVVATDYQRVGGYGNYVGLSAWGSGGSNVATRALIKWDMTAAPSVAIASANSVRVKLYLYAWGSNTSNVDVGIYKVSSTWATEANATWAMANNSTQLYHRNDIARAAAWYTFQWDGNANGLPEQNMGVSVRNLTSETGNTYYRRFSDKELAGGANTAPILEIDYNTLNPEQPQLSSATSV